MLHARIEGFRAKAKESKKGKIEGTAEHSHPALPEPPSQAHPPGGSQQVAQVTQVYNKTQLLQ